MSDIAMAADLQDIAAARDLFLEYARSLGFSLCFQGFDKEMATLPGDYGPPRGRLLLARIDGEAVGCVALRPLAADRCEMKRLYVRPDVRGRHLGRHLAERAIAEARALGYVGMALETLDSMAAARRLYAGLGFRETPANYDSPLDGIIYAELDLSH